MTAPASRTLGSLTRRNAVKVASAVSVEDCCLAMGEVVGHENIVSASKMNNATVVFLNTVEKANELVETGIIIDGLFTPVLPLSVQSKKVTLSNVPPFVSNEMLSQVLSRYGKMISPIKTIPIGCESPLLKHVVSFRRFVYMIMKDDAELDLSFKFRIEDFDYTVFATTGKMKCFGCGKTGHLVRDCPDKKEATINVNETAEQPVADRPAEDRNEAVAAERPVTGPAVQTPSSGESSVEVGNEAVTTLNLDAKVSAGNVALQNENVINLDNENNNNLGNGINVVHGESETDVNSGNDFDYGNGNVSSNGIENSINFGSGSGSSVLPVARMKCDDSGLDMETDHAVFKMPLKRKKSDIVCDPKLIKKSDVEFNNQEDTESGSESDSSVSLSQLECNSRSYEVDDIKLFLSATKNRRGINVKEYFPDLKQFVEKTKYLMSEGLFTNKEIYRLKKLLR